VIRRDDLGQMARDHAAARGGEDIAYKEDVGQEGILSFLRKCPTVAIPVI